MRAATLSKTIDLIVTQGMIDAGVRRSCGACPVALAAKARYLDACVGDKSVTLSYQMVASSRFAEYRLPRAVQRAVSAFDRGIAIQPMSIRLARIGAVIEVPGDLEVAKLQRGSDPSEALSSKH